MTYKYQEIPVLICRTIFPPVRVLFFLVGVFGLLIFASDTQARVVIPIPDRVGAAHDIAAVNDKAWLATDGGAYRIEGDNAVRITPEGVKASRILQLRDCLYVVAEQGLYLIEGNSSRRISEKQLNIETTLEADGCLWLLAQEGLNSEPDGGYVYRLEGDQLRQLTPDELHVRDMKLIGGRIWLLTRSSFKPGPAYRIDGDRITSVGGSGLEVSAVKAIGTTVWLVADGRLFRVEGDTLQPAFNEQMYVNDVLEVDGHVWVASKDGLYVIENGSTRLLLDNGLDISALSKAGGRVWISTTQKQPPGMSIFFNAGPLYCAVGEQFHELSEEVHSVEAAEEIDGRVWIVADYSAYLLEGDRLKRLTNVGDSVYGVENIGGRPWFNTAHGAYRVDDGGASVDVIGGVFVREIKQISGKVWLATDAGALRYDEDVEISVSFKATHSLWKSALEHLLPGEVWVSGVIEPQINYVSRTTGGDPYPESIPRRFAVVMDTDARRFIAAKNAGQFSAAEGFERSLDSGVTGIYAYVRDQWGNVTFYQEHVTVLPEGGTAAISSAVLLTSLLSLTLLLAIVTAPAVDFSQWLLMDPATRLLRPFHLVPTILAASPRVRTHLLVRYLLGILGEDNFRRWGQRFIVPDASLHPERVAALLREKRVLLLLGESGKGKTSVLEFLTAAFADLSFAGGGAAGFIPVFISLSLYQEEKDPFRMFAKELARLGQFTDDDLNLRLLRHGGFVIFIDGLNEADETTRNLIAEFVVLHRKKNYFCLSSQERYPKFADYETVRLEGFGPPQVAGFIAKHLDKAKSEEALSRFTEDTYKIYKSPQDLLFALRLLAGGKTLPPTKNELYKAVLSPILADWEDQGRAEHVSALYRRAYEMVRLSDFVFNRGEALPPSDIQNRLVEEKLMVCRDGACRFQHESVRAYLASKHFAGRWVELLADVPALDTNWRTVLEFSISELGSPCEAEAFTLAIFRKNQQLALNLAENLSSVYPHLYEEWVDRFIGTRKAQSNPNSA